MTLQTPDFIEGGEERESKDHDPFNWCFLPRLVGWVLDAGIFQFEIGQSKKDIGVMKKILIFWVAKCWLEANIRFHVWPTFLIVTTYDILTIL